VATNAQLDKLNAPDRFVHRPRSTRLHRLVDDGAVYIPQVLNRFQFTTLLALLKRMIPQPEVNPAHLAARLDSTLANPADSSTLRLTPSPLAFDYILALDELDTVARVRTGYAFLDLTTEIQDAMLSLIATRDVTTRKLDLSLWLKDLYRNAASCLAIPR
jgi:hypothetical protein